jgi:lipopolysaccharide/colanic/teichoic acid biosynthesis glycosyltransferase
MDLDRNQTQGRSASPPIGSGQEGLHAQELFRTLLVHERKRSERSKRQLLFVALHIQDALAETRGGDDLIDTITRSIAKVSRAIDIKGWYETRACIGVIYLETTHASEERIVGKLKQALASSLNAQLASRIGITHAFFPETDGKQWVWDRSGETLLYPDPIVPSLKMRIQLKVKRMMDVILSAIGIVVLAPFLLAVAAFIKATSPGQVVFKQERIGFGGKKFLLYKFRSMKLNNDCSAHQEFVTRLIAGTKVDFVPNEVGSYKIQGDPRVTRFGRFIRTMSIDELPQLFNVLQGTMSLVGPRPPLAYEVELYEAWHRPRLLDMKPGITGLWQVKGRSKTTFDGMVRMDLQYIRNWSLWLDVKLLLKTPVAVVTARGAH